MPAIEKFEITPKQKMACKKIEKAFKEAKKIGLVFLAKSETLCAYRENALEHAIPLHKPSSCIFFCPIKSPDVLGRINSILSDLQLYIGFGC